MNQPKITILTVNYNSYEYLNGNIANFKRHNPDLEVDWIVVDNSEKPQEILGPARVLQGIPFGSWDETKHLGVWGGSIPHSEGLDLGLKSVQPETEILITMDPDFFVNKPLLPIIEYMKSKEFAFHGAAYSNKRKDLYRDFPCAYFMMVDLKKVNINELEFHAGYKNEEERDSGIYSGYPDTGFRVYLKFKDVAHGWCEHTHNYKFPCLSDWYSKLYSMHMRAKVERTDRIKQHRSFINDIIAGKYD